MTESLLLAPSILSADFGRLADEISSVAPYVDWFHLDVMDGHYVPNLTFGPATVAAVREATDRPIHVHLMITDPARFAGAFAEAGARRISFHPEVADDPARVIEVIHEAGAGVGIAVHPDVDTEVAGQYLDEIEVILMMTVRPGFGGQEFLVDVVPKIIRARELAKSGAGTVEVEVDGGVNLNTVERAVRAGGQILVAGSAIFDGVDPPAAAQRLRARVDELAGEIS